MVLPSSSESWASSEAARATMRANRRSDTTPELRLRRELHRRGLRYRVDSRLPLSDVRRHADLTFTRQRVAVFVDGCFWHRCPEHGRMPKANADYWDPKLEGNTTRDRDTDQRLTEAGWQVVRIWEHEDVGEAATRIEHIVRSS